MEQILSTTWNGLSALVAVYGPLYWLQAPANATKPYTVAHRTGSIEQTTKDDLLRENAEVSIQLDTYTTTMLTNVAAIKLVQDAIPAHMIIEQMMDDYDHDREVYRKMHFIRIF